MIVRSLKLTVAPPIGTVVMTGESAYAWLVTAAGGSSVNLSATVRGGRVQNRYGVPLRLIREVVSEPTSTV